MFKFVKVHEMISDEHYLFTPTAAPWEARDFKDHLTKRQEMATPRKKEDWRKDVNRYATSYEMRYPLIAKTVKNMFYTINPFS